MNAPNTNEIDVTKATPLLSNPDAQEGLEELLQKLEPLLAGRRLNRIVDLMSVISDVVDMTDDYMVEKLCKTYEEAIGAAWTVGNVTRMASNEVRQLSEPPGTWELIKMARDKDAQRGLAFMLMVAKGLGKQMNTPLPEDD